MKTSDKLLWFFFLTGMATLTAVQLTLHAKYAKHEIVTAETLTRERFTRYDLPVKTYVSVKGFQSVIIIPSDRFYVDIEKHPGGRAGYLFQKDSILILGDSVENKIAGIHNQGQRITLQDQSLKKISLLADVVTKLSSQQLIVHCIPFQKFHLDNGEIYFQGSTDSLKTNFEAEIDHCVFNFSNRNYFDTAYQNKFYHFVTLRCRSSFVNLRTKTVLSCLRISMDDQSELVDNNADIQHLQLGCSDKSKLQLSGENIRKAILFSP